MSLVGPRPEVRKYVDLYTDEQKKVLSVRPGITDYASIEYVDENMILGEASDPDRAYIEQIMPDKIRYNMKYICNRSVKEYFKNYISDILEHHSLGMFLRKLREVLLFVFVPYYVRKNKE